MKIATFAGLVGIIQCHIFVSDGKVPVYDKRGFFTAQTPSRAFIQDALNNLYGSGDGDFVKRGPLDYINDLAPNFGKRHQEFRIKRGSAAARLKEALKKYRSRSNADTSAVA